MAPMLEKSRYQAQAGWVIVEKCRKDTGIVVQLGEAQYENYARVVSVGPGRIADNGQRVKPRIKVGDLVIGKDGPRVWHALPGDAEVAAIFEDDIITTVDPSVPVKERPAAPTIPLVQVAH